MSNLYRFLFVLNFVLIALMIFMSTLDMSVLTRILQIVVFLLSVYLFYTYSKHEIRRKK